jgi:azurin
MYTMQISLRRWLALAAVGCQFALIAAAPAPPAAKIQIRAIDGLRFDLPRFSVQPGEKVRLLVENRDDSGMQHNLLITRPGARETVVQQALALGAQGAAMNYVPRTKLVLWATPLLATGGGVTIDFTAPKEPGVYPYVCTFPGHGFVMYGAMYVGVEMPALATDENVPPNARTQGAARPKPVEITRPKLYRYPMPDVGPAAIAVALPGDQNYVWDAGAVRLRYAWTGGFVDRTESLEGQSAEEMQLPATLLGEVYYRAGSTYPIRIGGLEGDPAVRFRGYRLVAGIPEFRYEVDGVEVREVITPAPGGKGLVRAFSIGETTQPVYFVREPRTGADFRASAGRWEGDVLRLTGPQARRFSITMTQSQKERSGQ